MKPSAVYREAARMIAEGERTLSCTTIISVSLFENGSQGLGLAYKYANLFSLHELSNGLWLDSEIPPDLRQQWRVLALCFMAAIADAGDA